MDKDKRFQKSAIQHSQKTLLFTATQKWHNQYQGKKNYKKTDSMWRRIIDVKKTVLYQLIISVSAF